MDEVPRDADRARGRTAPPEGRRLRWVWAVAYLLFGVVGGIVGVVAGDSRGDSFGFWLTVLVVFLLCTGFGAGMGLLLRRRLGWRQSAWGSRIRQLSWRQRMRIAWATERARAVDDPELARAAVERSEFGLRAMGRLGDWFLLAIKVGAVLIGILVVLLGVALAVDAGRGEPVEWTDVVFLAVTAGIAAVLPWLQRRLWGWATRRLERTLALNREIVARADGGTAEA